MAFWDSVIAPTKSFWSGVVSTPSPYAGTLGDLGKLGTTSLATKTSTQAIPDATTPSTAGFVAGALQAVPRDAASVGISVGNLVNKNTIGQTIDPAKAGFWGKTILGSEPIKGLADTAAGYEQRLGGPGKVATPIAVLGATLPVALDFLGLGGEKAATDAVIRAGTEADAVRVLSKLGIPEDIAKEFAPRVMMASSEADAKVIFNDIAKAKATTQVIDQGAPKAAEAVTPTETRLPESPVEPVRPQPEMRPLESGQLPSPVLSPSVKDISLEGSRLSINTDKLLISPEGKDLVTQTVKEIKPTIEQFVGKPLTNKEALNLSEQSSKILTTTIGRDQTLAWEASMLKARQALSAASESGTIDENYIKNLLTIKTQGTDIARKLQSLSIGADAVEPTGKQAILEAVLKVNQNTDEILKAAEGVNFNDLKQATDFYRTFIAPKTSEYLDLLRYNSMLSSPKTHIINAASNFMNTSFMAPLEKAITGGLDFLGSKLTGSERKYFVGEGAQYFKHYLSNVKKAVLNFADVMSGKKMYTNLDTRNIPIATKGAKGAAVSVLAFPTRLLEAMDQFFITIGEGGELGALRYRAGKGVEVGNIEEQARKAAEYRLYRQKPGDESQGTLLDAVDEFTHLVQRARNSSNPLVSNVAKFTVPFIQTPMNILKQGIEYSPLGVLTLPGAAYKTEQLSKAIIGSAVFTGAATMLVSNRVTWGEPIDAAGKRDFRAAKQQPYSVKFGNTWYSYQKLPPAVAFPFALLAGIHDAEKTKKIDDTTVQLVLSIVAKYGQFLSDQSYAKSVGDLLSSVQGGENSLANVLSNDVQQLIPFRALGGWLARLTDPIQRKVDTNGSLLEKQIQLLMLNIPGLSEKVPARLDAQGNPIAQPNPVGNAVSPVQTTKQSTDEWQKYQNLLDYKQEKKVETAARSKEMDRLQPVYDQVQALLRAGDEDGARSVVTDLSDADYEIYKAVRTADHAANTTQFRTLIHTSPADAVKFVRGQLPAEGQRLINVLTDDEYKLYESGKTQASAGTTSGDLALNMVPAVPRNAEEKKIIENGTKAGMFMTRDPNGDLNGLRNYPLDTLEGVWNHVHPGSRLAMLTSAQTAHAAEGANPTGGLVEEPRSLLDRLTGTSAARRVPTNAMGTKIDNETITRGIVGAENSGKSNYGVVGVTGDLGKFQANPSTLAAWSKSWLGTRYSKDEFLKDPKAQEEFFKQFLAVATRYNLTPEETAVAWHAGWGELGTGPSATREARFRAKLAEQMQTPENKRYVEKFSTFINS